MLLRLFGAAALAVALTATPALAQRSARAAAQAQVGWAAIRDGHNQQAAEAFASAIAAEPRDPSLYLGAGLAAYLMGHVTEAQQSLEHALDLAPRLTAASMLLGDILYRNNDLAGAARVYEAALRYAPDDKTLADRLDKARHESEVQSNFFQSQGAHFTVLFEGPSDEELSRKALDVLEAAYYRVGTELLTFPDRNIPVVLYTEQQFKDITRSPDWAAAAYDGRIRVPMRGALTQPEELERVLTHEFTHALVQTIAPRGVPTWLNEGLAVTFEPGGGPWAQEQLTSSSLRLPMQRLAAGFDRLSGAQARMAYAQSASAVRAMLDLGGAAALVGMLQDVGGGMPFETAFAQRMSMSYAEFLASLDPAH